MLVLLGVFVLFSDKDTSQTGLEPTLMTLVSLNYSLKDTVSEYSHTLRRWGLDFLI